MKWAPDLAFFTAAFYFILTHAKNSLCLIGYVAVVSTKVMLAKAEEELTIPMTKVF
jgi:hypothetical protein